MRFPRASFLTLAIIGPHPLPSPASAAVPPSELAALSDLYFATNGTSSWIRTTGWATLTTSTPTDPCEDGWFGVTCDEGGGHVTGLDLTTAGYVLGNGLVGPLPESLGNLTRIKVLRLGTKAAEDSNVIYGETPATLCNTALEEIHMRYVMGMSGSLPECIGQLKNLTYIDFTEAGTLTGSLPRGLCDLTDLAYVELQFTSGISGEGENGGGISTCTEDGRAVLPVRSARPPPNPRFALTPNHPTTSFRDASLMLGPQPEPATGHRVGGQPARGPDPGLAPAPAPVLHC